MMKKLTIILGLFVAFMSTLMAQTVNQQAISNSQQYCPGLFNPTAFTITGANTAKASWTGFGAGGLTGGPGNLNGYSGPNQERVSTVGNWGMVFTPGGRTATAQQIDANANTVEWEWLHNGSSCTPGNQSANDVYKRRFYINSVPRNASQAVRMDDLTNNGLSRVPPNDPDTVFTSSIRLGNRCGGSHEAEMLQYQFKVNYENSLLVIYYSMVLEAAYHSPAQNPEFVIEVQVGTPTASTIPSDLNTFTYAPIGIDYFYTQPSPTSSANVTSSGFVQGNNCAYYPWNKVVINLGNYINYPVRILLGAGDCNMSAHYGYAYFAGYCRPGKVTANGCPLGNNTFVSTLYAPSGLADAAYAAQDPNYLPYKWYMTRDQFRDLREDDISGDDLVDNDWFNSHFIEIQGAPNVDSLNVSLANLTYQGQALEYRTFVCEMTTFMNKDKVSSTSNVRAHPIRSRLKAMVNNTKPMASFDHQEFCNGDIKMINTSSCLQPDYMTDTLTRWSVYTNPGCTGTPVATGVSKDFLFHTDGTGTYYFRAEVTTVDSVETEDHAVCYAEKNSAAIRPISTPVAQILTQTNEPCLGDTINLQDGTDYSASPRNSVLWTIGDTTLNTPTISYSFENATDTVWMYVTNSYSEPVGNSATERKNCADTAFTVINVFTSPELAVSDDTIVCEGKRTNVTVSVVDDDPNATYDYDWYRVLGGNNRIQSGQVLQQIPDAGHETSTYYVKVTRQPQGCEAWDSITVHVVRPTLELDRDQICPGEKVTLTAGAAHHYSWLANGAPMTQTEQEIQVSPSSTTTYTLIGHGSDNCDADPLTKTVTVFKTPVPTIHYNPSFVDSEDPVVTFRDDSPNGVTTRWDFGDGKTSTERQVSHEFTDLSSSDSVTVTLRSYNALGNQAPGCSAAKTIQIPIELFAVWMPNAFTPELADNSKFKLSTANVVENFRIYIYDRHGQLVFQSSDQNFEWDGTYKGAECPQGAYVWVMSYRRQGTPEVTQRKGTLTLIR